MTPSLRYRSLFIVLMVCLVTICNASTSMAFKLNTRTYDTSDFPLKVALVGDPPAPLTHKEVERAITTSIAQWNNVQCSVAQMEYVGRREASAPGQDDIIRVAFVEPGADPCFPEAAKLVGITADICAADYQAVVLLNTRDYYWSTSPYEPQALIPSQSQFDALVIDLPGTLTHEFGHILGLAHPDTGIDPQDETLATMSSRYQLDGGQASLSADDRLGLCTKYPKEDALVTCTTQAQCERRLGRVGATCIKQGELSVCEEPRGELGDYCAVDTMHCPQGCVYSSPEVGTGYCTISCDEDNPCPELYTCTTNAADGRQYCALTGSGVTPDTGCQHTLSREPVGLFLLLGGMLWLRRRRRTQVT